MSIEDLKKVAFENFVSYFEGNYELDREELSDREKNQFYKLALEKAKKHYLQYEREYSAGAYNANLKRYTIYRITPFRKIQTDQRNWLRQQSPKIRNHFPAGDWEEYINDCFPKGRLTKSALKVR